MILVVSTCGDIFSEEEFVRPVADIIKKSNVNTMEMHYSKITGRELEKAQAIVVCGCALEDFTCLNEAERFGWIRCLEKPFLGICAGNQLLAKAFGSGLTESLMIGKHAVEVKNNNRIMEKDYFDSYFINSFVVTPSKELSIIAESAGNTVSIKHNERNLFGVQFHPEVLNPEIITNFVNLVQGEQTQKNHLKNFP